MTTQFAFDLRLARRRAGLTQADCAHLMGIQQSRISELESGEKSPSAHELCVLSIILDRRFEGYISDELSQLTNALGPRLTSLPRLKRISASTFNRHRTLERLRHLMRDKHDAHGGA